MTMLNYSVYCAQQFIAPPSGNCSNTIPCMLPAAISFDAAAAAADSYDYTCH